jgi:hypothetical protein
MFTVKCTELYRWIVCEKVTVKCTELYDGVFGRSFLLNVLNCTVECLGEGYY